MTSDHFRVQVTDIRVDPGRGELKNQPTKHKRKNNNNKPGTEGDDKTTCRKGF